MSETNLFSEGFSIGWGIVSQIEIVDELFSILDCAFLLGRQGSQAIDSDCQFDTHIPTLMISRPIQSCNLIWTEFKDL